MKQIKKQKVNKLFYNKWPYKVECLIPGANKITIYGHQRVMDWCNGSNNNIGRYDSTKHIDRAEMKNFLSAVEPYINDKEQIQIRTEGGHFNLFFKDNLLLDRIVKDLKKWVWSVYEPGSEKELEFLLDNENKRILCDNIPHEKYTYKVVLRNISSNTREQFYQWSKSYGEDKIKISKETIKWLEGKMYYKQDPFFYVSDGPMMTMTRLFLGDGVRRVYEYVPRNELEKG